MPTFDEQVAAWARKVEGRIEAVTKQAAQQTFDYAQIPTAQGGRMRVDTGFLRNSIVAAVGQIPTGPSEGPYRVKTGIQWRDTPGSGDVSAEIASWDIQRPLYVGWSANYARYREAYDGFLEGALMRWPQFCEAAAQRAMREIK